MGTVQAYKPSSCLKLKLFAFTNHRVFFFICLFSEKIKHLTPTKKTKDDLMKEAKISSKPNTSSYSENEAKYRETIQIKKKQS